MFKRVCDTLRMSRSAPASYHLDLYRYWLAKRGGRPMPPRSDINPTEIPALLPYLGIIEKADGELRYRLMGTSMVEQLGFDATGAGVGSYVPAGQALRNTAGGLTGLNGEVDGRRVATGTARQIAGAGPQVGG